jgi:hypothetical protein
MDSPDWRVRLHRNGSTTDFHHANLSVEESAGSNNHCLGSTNLWIFHQDETSELRLTFGCAVAVLIKCGLGAAPPTRYPSPAIGTNRRYASGRDGARPARRHPQDPATARVGLRTPRTRRNQRVLELSVQAFQEGTGDRSTRRRANGAVRAVPLREAVTR